MDIRPSTAADAAAVIDIWRRAVDATHHFLLPDDRLALDTLVCGFLPQAPLVVAVDRGDRPQAFMLLDDGHMEALFVAPEAQGQGIGSALIAWAVFRFPGLTTDVNLQNGRALAFYLGQGFKETGRSAVDGQGRPYPLVHLRRCQR